MPKYPITFSPSAVERQPATHPVSDRGLVWASIISTTLTLVACGGGSDSTTSTVIAPQTPQSVPIQTTVPEPPLAAGTSMRLALDYLNRQRVQCGFGALRYNTRLQVAGEKHAYYANANGTHPQFHPHIEVTGLVGFTAAWPTERARLQGYQTNGAEVGEIGLPPSQYTATVDLYRSSALHLIETEVMRGLSIAPYHAMHFFGAYTEVGIGMDKTETLLPASQFFIGNVPIKRPESIQLNYSIYAMLGFGMDQLGQQPPAGSGVRTYPCEGSTDVSPALYGEWTDPTLGPGVTPGRDLGKNPTGSTIMVIGEMNQPLVLQSASLTRVQTGEAVGMYSIRTKANDPMAVYYRNNWTGYAMPDRALEPNTQYRAQLTGTSGGVPFTRSFTFTTGLTRVAP